MEQMSKMKLNMNDQDLNFHRILFPCFHLMLSLYLYGQENEEKKLLFAKKEN